MIPRSTPLLIAAAILASPATMAQTAPTSPSVAATAASPVFVIPFRRGATNVGSDAEDVLDRVVAYAQRNRTMHLMISGLSNAAGNDNVRMGRAMLMAQSVQDYLQESGIGGARLHVEATGSMPDAVTAPVGVSDPAAARVVISFVSGPAGR